MFRYYPKIGGRPQHDAIHTPGRDRGEIDDHVHGDGDGESDHDIAFLDGHLEQESHRTHGGARKGV